MLSDVLQSDLSRAKIFRKHDAVKFKSCTALLCMCAIHVIDNEPENYSTAVSVLLAILCKRRSVIAHACVLLLADVGVK